MGCEREKIVAMQLRMPDSLHKALVEIAAREHRSLHQQIIHTLTDFVADEARKSCEP
jgi:predicted HicB family RNase H-like nuclease